MSKRAIVFGGAGFIGSHLLKYLSESGEYEKLISADIVKPRFETPGVIYKNVDLTKPIADDVNEDCTEIYNLAAVHTTPGHEDWEYYWTNVLGATHVCDFARRCNISHITFTSSISVYAPTEEPLDEDCACSPTSAYGKSKFAAEKIHRLWQAEQPEQRRLVIVRPGVIYGYTERGNFTRLAKLLSKRSFVYPGRKDTIKSCGYVVDLVRSMRFMMEKTDSCTTYNFCYPQRYTAEEICATFSAVGGYPEAKYVFPLSLMLAGGMTFEVLSKIGLKTSINRARVMKLNRSTNIIPKRLVESGFPYKYDLKSSLEEWRATSKTFD